MVVPAVFVAAFFLYPIATILWRGLGGGGGETFLDLAASSRQRDIAWFTIWQAIASTVLTLAVGLPAASVVARLSARRQRLVRALVTVPFVLPTVVVAGVHRGVRRCRTRRRRASASSHRLGDPDRPRVLQLCGRRSGGGFLLGRP